MIENVGNVSQPMVEIKNVFAFNNSNFSKCSSSSPLRRGVVIKAPFEDTRSTGADEGTAALRRLSRCLTML